MKTKQILKWPLIIGIIIVLNLFFLYAIKVTYPKPIWNDFCDKELSTKKIETESECLEIDGQWVENSFDASPPLPTILKKTDASTPATEGYCNRYFTCSKLFDTTREDYEGNVFIALIIFGVISVMIGFMIKGREVISIALSLGGVLSFIIASIRYWQYASDYLHLGILAIALLVLIWLGIKKFTE